MEEIQIILRPATTQGCLLYQSDPEVADHLIYIKSPQFRQATYFLELEDPVLFRLNANRILGLIKVVIPRRVWTMAPPHVLPQATMHANLEFSRATIQQGSFDLRATVTTDAAYRHALITWGCPEQESMWVALSSSCWAMIAADRLKGIFVSLHV